jgi:hypothetical protein
MNLIEIEREYLVKKHEGQSFSEMRKELESKGLSNEQITVVIRSIDNKLIKREVNEFKSGVATQLILMGFFLLVIGLLVTYGTYSGFINSGQYYYLYYGPIIGGVGLIGIGLAKK